MSVALEGHSERPSKTEIGNLEHTLVLVDQKVLRLEISEIGNEESFKTANQNEVNREDYIESNQIPMKNTVAVAVGDALAQLIEEALDQSRRERPRVWAFAVGIDVFLEIGVEILKHKVQQRLSVLVDVLDAEEADDVERIGEHLEQ